MAPLSLDKRQLCDIQGRLFELALAQGYDCPAFVRAFMNSRTAAALDDVYDRLQWAGEEYILEELSDEVGGLATAGATYARETMYWMGYLYRYWHYYTSATSAEMFAIADDATLATGWPALHTLDVEAAIDRLVEAASLRA